MCLATWRTLTSDPQILSIVSGYKITFFKTPFQKFPRFTQSSGQEALLISQEVNELLQKGAIERTPFSRDGFYSHLFLVPKKDGPMRPVIDLSYLNKFILNEHFQMENLSCLKTLRLKGDFMTNIDLKDAYLSVPVHQSSQKFLRFIWEDTCYQFKALPFGLCSAPRIFTKLMKPIAAFLRRKSIRVLIYLDDFLLLAATREEAVKNTHLLITLLQSGFQNRLNVYDAVTPSRKDQQNPRLCSPSTSSSKDHSTKPSKLNWFTRGLSASHLASTTPFPPPAMRPHMGPTNEPRVLLRPNYSVNKCQRRTRLVVGKHPQYKRQPCTPTSSRYVNHDRRLHERLGCGSSLPRDQWQMVTTGVSPTHQLPGAESSLPGLKNFSQRQVSRNRISANRQHNRHRLYQQQRGYTFPPTPDPCPGIVGLVPGKRHLCDSFSHPRKRQRLCRQGVERIQGHERVEVRPIHHPTLSITLSDRPVRESPNKPTEGLHQLETRPRSHPHRRLHDNLGSSARLRLSSIQLDIQNSGEGNDRTNRDNSSRPNLANPALVAGSVEASNISASATAKQSNPPNRPVRSEQSSPDVSSPPLGRVSHLYQRFQAEGIPTNVADLLIAATRTSTHKTYESSWNRWCRWCSGWQIDPLSSSINDILIFLTEVFNEGLAYRSINGLRSAISSTHPKIDGYSVGQHPYVTRLLRGVLNKRPPKPRYSHTWNVDIMTKYIISLGKNSSLTLKVLSMKLVTLFALTCPERISTLANLDLRHCYVLPEGVSFQLTIPRKTGSVDKPAEAFFARFNQDKKLCPVECFRHYLKLTRNIRPVIPSSLPDKLFISFKRPFKPVTTTTLGRWLRTFMSAAGIDCQIFKAHSVRSASTTAAAKAFVPLSTIMSMADWSSSSTFRTFYYKPLYNSDFAIGVLSSK